MVLKKVMSVLMVSTVCVLGFAGCGGQPAPSGGDSQSGQTEQSKTQESSESSETGNDSGEKVKLTALISTHSLTKDVNEMEWLCQFEEAANVEIEWQQISADWDQKKSALFGSGDIPDILINATSDADYVQFDGLFEDLTPLIEENGTNVKVMFEEHPELKALCTTLDGKIYGLPYYEKASVNTRPLFINQVWLDNLSLEMPTTWDELENVLIAFKEQDANGNGDPSDEIPMDFQGIPNTRSPIYFLGSLGIKLSDDAGGGYFLDNGTVKCIYTDERLKTLLQFLRELWAKELLNNELFTQDYSKFQSLARGEGTTAKVGVSWGWSRTDRFGTELADQYVSVPPLKYSADQDESEITWMNSTNSFSTKGNCVAMSANCSNKEAAMRFIDVFYDKANGVQVKYGGTNDIDKGTVDNGDGTYSILPPADPSMDPDAWRWTHALVNGGPYYIPDEITVIASEAEQEVSAERDVYQDAISRIQISDIYPQAFMKYSADDTNTMAMNQANIDNIASQQLTAWITGEGDIEGDWDNFVKSLENAGITENLEIRQEAYERYLSIME